MNFKSIVAKIRNFENTQGTVEGLYLLSIRNFLINILLATLVSPISSIGYANSFLVCNAFCIDRV